MSRTAALPLALCTAQLFCLLAPGAAGAQNYSRPVTVRQGGHQIEYFLEGKGGPSESRRCEDGLFFNERFLAVVDGATDKSGKRYDRGETGGRVVRGLILETFAALPADADKVAVVNRINGRIRAFYKQHGAIDYAKEPIYRLTASLIWYSFSRRELVALGDCKARADGRPYNHKGFFLDRLNADVRALAIKALGGPRASMLRDDPSLGYILPLLRAQAGYQNNPQAPAPFAYWVIDGFDVPPRKIRSWRLPGPPRVIELSSDGYPGFPKRATVAAYEARLRRALRLDPMCIKECRSTKGLKPGQASFDDRAVLIWRRSPR